MLKNMLRAAALVPLLLGSTSIAFAQTAPAGDPVVARVDGAEIKRSDVNALIAQLPPNVREMPAEKILPELIDQLVNMRLLTAAGLKADLQKTDQVKADVKAAEERAVQRAYIRGLLDAKITPSMLRNEYEKQVATNPPEEEVRASHILVESEAEAKAILDDLAKGADFAKIAKEKSKDPTAAAQGGDLGWFTAETMVEEFSKAAFALKPGETVKAPVKTQFGWHVIKLVDRRVPPPPTLEEMKPDLEKAFGQKIITNEVERLRAAAKIEILTPPEPVKAEPEKK